MARPEREDFPGAWLHLVNRGLARRTVFENEAEVAGFLGLLALVSAEGLMETHAYSILGNHFHLLVRSPEGKISVAMKRVMERFVRGFNRPRSRDGPLFRSRYWSRVLEDEDDWLTVLRYIDRNPVAAGLVTCSTDHPHGSAWWYSHRRSGPPWLTRPEVEDAMGLNHGRDYPRETNAEQASWIEEVVDRRTRSLQATRVPGRTLLRGGNEGVRDWVKANAVLADGIAPGWVIVSAGGLEVAAASGAPVPGEEGLLPVLGRLCAGLTYREIADRWGGASSTHCQKVREWILRIQGDEVLRFRAAEILSRALAAETVSVATRPGGTLPLILSNGVRHRSLSNGV